MINFGTSAVLKIISLNPKPMMTELKKRANKKQSDKKGGYDYHGSLKRAVTDYIKNPTSLKEIVSNLKTIKKQSERTSAITGLDKTIQYIRASEASIYKPEIKIYKDPSELFTIKFQPNFGLETDDKKFAIHVWNTKSVKLTERNAKVILGLFLKDYVDERPIILCLKTMNTYYSTGTEDDKIVTEAVITNLRSKIIEITDNIETSSTSTGTAG